MKSDKSISWQSELVNVAYQDGQKIAMLYQNGELEMYMLKKASKVDVIELLEINVIK